MIFINIVALELPAGSRLGSGLTNNVTAGQGQGRGGYRGRAKGAVAPSTQKYRLFSTKMNPSPPLANEAPLS